MTLILPFEGKVHIISNGIRVLGMLEMSEHGAILCMFPIAMHLHMCLHLHMCGAVSCAVSSKTKDRTGHRF